MKNIELLMETYPDFIKATETFTNALLPDGEDIYTFFPNFEVRITYARAKALAAQARRNEMPVIEDTHLEDLKKALTEGGYLSWCEECSVSPMDMSPYQCQIHVNKCIENTVKYGTIDTRRFLNAHYMFVDTNDVIIDGHHRWLTAMLIDWTTPLPAFKIKADIHDIMPLLLAFSDQHSERNM